MLRYPPNIVSALNKKGMTIIGVALKCGISVATLRKILLGQRSNSRVFRGAAEKRIAEILGIPVASLRNS